MHGCAPVSWPPFRHRANRAHSSAARMRRRASGARCPPRRPMHAAIPRRSRAKAALERDRFAGRRIKRRNRGNEGDPARAAAILRQLRREVGRPSSMSWRNETATTWDLLRREAMPAVIPLTWTRSRFDRSRASTRDLRPCRLRHPRGRAQPGQPRSRAHAAPGRPECQRDRQIRSADSRRTGRVGGRVRAKPATGRLPGPYPHREARGRGSPPAG